MTLKSGRQGFTLLELLVVLVILTVMTSLVAPNLVRIAANSRANSEAHSLQKTLQRVFDQQWMSRQTSFLQVDQEQLVLWQNVTGTWRPAEVVYTFNNELDYELSFNKNRLSSAQQTVNMSVPMALFVLESGEYLPFRWRVVEGDHQVTVVGDGLNALSVE